MFTAFERAKQLAYDDILNDRGGNATLYLREALRDQLARWGDIYRNGLATNRTAIDTFIKYNLEQGLVDTTPPLDQIFAASTLDT